jgi:hypothetical protein
LYNENNTSVKNNYFTSTPTNSVVYFKQINIEIENDLNINYLNLRITVSQLILSKHYSLEFEIVSTSGIKIFFCALGVNQKINLIEKKENFIELKLPIPKKLAIGNYFCNCIIASRGAIRLQELNEKLQFEISSSNWPKTDWQNDLSYNVGPLLIEACEIKNT